MSLFVKNIKVWRSKCYYVTVSYLILLNRETMVAAENQGITQVRSNIRHALNDLGLSLLRQN